MFVASVVLVTTQLDHVLFQLICSISVFVQCHNYCNEFDIDVKLLRCLLYHWPSR